LRERFKKIAPQIAFLEAIRAELPDDGIFVDEVTQMGFAARIALPVYRPRTFLSPGYQDNLGWGYATALGAAHARPDVPVVSINGDGGFMYTANELATAVRHKIPLTAVVFTDGAFGNVRRIQEEKFGNRMIASDLANPDFVKFGEAFGAAAERAKTPEELRLALRRGFARRDGPTLIEVPVGPFPSPWEFILMPKNRGRSTLAAAEIRAAALRTGARNRRVRLVAEADASAVEIVRRHFNNHPVALERADAMLAHLARRIGEDRVIVVEFYAKVSVRQDFGDRAVELKHLFFRHTVLRV
jgi:hypothetical protein